MEHADFRAECDQVGDDGVDSICHLLRKRVGEGSVFVIPGKGRGASSALQRLQISGGDMLLEAESGTAVVECKTERRWRGRFCYELWHCYQRQMPGWARQIEGDMIAYRFEDPKFLYTFLFRWVEYDAAVKSWASQNQLTGRIGEDLTCYLKVPHAYPDRQPNQTAFWAVPVQTILDAKIWNRVWVGQTYLGDVDSWADFAQRRKQGASGFLFPDRTI